MESINDSIHVSVLSGGIGPEREVSLSSGQALADALKDHYSVDLIDLCEAKVPESLNSRETVVFPVIHGTFGEDGALQSMLEAQNFSYAGSTSQASRLCMNKVQAKQVVSQKGIGVAQDLFFENPGELEIEEVIGKLGPDLVLKPTDQGSSVALYVLSGQEELQSALADLPRGNWMLEKRIFGREFTVGVLPKMPLGIVEVIPQGGVYDYRRKYTPGSTDYKFPAVLPCHLEEELKSMAMASFAACGCRDFARIDFIVCEDGNPYFLEVNTLPGLTATSLLPKSASCAGYDFSKLVKKLIEPAIARFSELNLLPAA